MQGIIKNKALSKSWINTIAKNVSKDYLKSSYKKVSDNAVADDDL